MKKSTHERFNFRTDAYIYKLLSGREIFYIKAYLHLAYIYVWKIIDIYMVVQYLSTYTNIYQQQYLGHFDISPLSFQEPI